MIGSSELIINRDGSIFHLHLKPEQLADHVILVGDPARVGIVTDYFQEKELKVQNREFVSVTGTCNGLRISVISTGIGTDNIDIVMNELDALANIDFQTRTVREQKRSLNIIRIGTSGSVQHQLSLSDFVLSAKAIGLDGLLNFYEGRNRVCNLVLEEQFKKHTGWNSRLASPYVVDCSPFLLEKFSGEKTTKGITATAPGFYGPQGRVLRLRLADPDINKKLESFATEGLYITNYEMECAAIYGLAALMGHQALTACLIIADRLNRKTDVDYNSKMKELIEMALEKLTGRPVILNVDTKIF